MTAYLLLFSVVLFSGGITNKIQEVFSVDLLMSSQSIDKKDCEELAERECEARPDCTFTFGFCLSTEETLFGPEEEEFDKDLEYDDPSQCS